MQQVDRCLSIEPSTSGQVTLPRDFVLFVPNVLAFDGSNSQTPTIQ